MSTKQKLKAFANSLSEEDATTFVDTVCNVLAEKAGVKIVKCKPKVDEKVASCLVTNNERDKELVNGVFTNLIEEMGEKEALNLFDDMDDKGIKLIDVINHLQHGNDGEALQLPVMKFQSPLDRVQKHLESKHGRIRAAEKLKVMSAEEIILLNDKLKKVNANETEDDSLRLPPLFSFEEEKEESDVLLLPEMKFDK